MQHFYSVRYNLHERDSSTTRNEHFLIAPSLNATCPLLLIQPHSCRRPRELQHSLESLYDVFTQIMKHRDYELHLLRVLRPDGRTCDLQPGPGACGPKPMTGPKVILSHTTLTLHSPLLYSTVSRLCQQLDSRFKSRYDQHVVFTTYFSRFDQIRVQLSSIIRDTLFSLYCQRVPVLQ